MNAIVSTSTAKEASYNFFWRVCMYKFKSYCKIIAEFDHDLHYVFDTDYPSTVTCLPIAANSNLRIRFSTILVTWSLEAKSL